MGLWWVVVICENDGGWMVDESMGELIVCVKRLEGDEGWVIVIVVLSLLGLGGWWFVVS